MAGYPFNNIEEPLLKHLIKKPLVIGIGGGGDVVGAVHIYMWLRRLGAECLLASIPWERFTVDPTPGPISISEINGGRIVGNYAVLVEGNEYVVRGGRRIIPQGVRIARLLKVNVALIDATYGEHGIRRGIEELANHFGVDLVVGVDVGGDVTAQGSEDNLWSPLMDSLALSAIANSRLYGLIGIHSIGADGELDIDVVLSRIAEIAKNNGLICVYGLCREDMKVLEMILREVETEASRIAYLALQGFKGDKCIRLGTRRVHISPYSLVTFLVDASVLYGLSPMAQMLSGTKSILEANERLNNACIYTELNLEEDLYALLNLKRSITKNDVLCIYMEGVKRMKEKCKNNH